MRAMLPLLSGILVGVAAVLVATIGAEAPGVPVASERALPTRTSQSRDALSEVGAAADSVDVSANAVALAQRSPDTALAEFAALDAPGRLAVNETLARALARDDPVAALGRIGNFRGEAAAELRDALLVQWSLDDPEAVLDWLASISLTRDYVVIFNEFPRWTQALAASAPELVLAATDAIPGDFGSTLRTLAVRALAERDPGAAAELTLATASRTDRDRYATAIGSVVAAHDPDLALEWLRSMDAPHWNAIENVISGISQTNLALAVEVMLTEPVAQNTQITGLMVRREDVPLATVANIAERILEFPGHPKAQGMLQQILRAWADSDIDRVIDWILANEQRLVSVGQTSTMGSGVILGPRLTSGTNVLSSLAQSYAQRDLESAMRVADRLPPEQRGAWIQSALGAAAGNDPNEALRLLEPYRGDVFFVSTYEDVVRRSMMMGSPQAAARLLESAPAASRERLTSMLAQRWASVDPAGARGWVLAMPRGESRDRVLGSLLSEIARSGEIDDELLSAFSNPTQRGTALVNVVVALGQVDEASARRVIDERFDDEAQRARAESALDRVLAMRAQLPR